MTSGEMLAAAVAAGGVVESIGWFKGRLSIVLTAPTTDARRIATALSMGTERRPGNWQASTGRTDIELIDVTKEPRARA